MICFILSCTNKQQNYITYDINLDTIPTKHITLLEEYIIDELYNPYAIYAINNNIVVLNIDQKDYMLYVYDKNSLKFKYPYGTYGRGPNEYIIADKSPINNNDSTLFLYTNISDCSSFKIGEDSIKKLTSFRFTQDIENNALIINDSLTFSSIFNHKEPFKIFNYKNNSVECYFGEFPKSTIPTVNHDDRDNVLSSTSVHNFKKNSILTFYANIPEIHEYDLNNFTKCKEIHLRGLKKQITSIDDYYNGYNIVYSIKPIITNKNIYTILINDISYKIPTQTTLLKFDFDGNIVKRYTFDKAFITYTITNNEEFYAIGYDGEDTKFYRAKL